VKPHPFFSREGDVLLVELPLTISEAALGGEVDVPVLDGVVRMKIPEGTQSGSVFRIRGKGIPRPSGGRGDCHVKTIVETPVGLGAGARELLGRLPAEIDESASLPRRQALRAAMSSMMNATASAAPGGTAAGEVGAGPSNGHDGRRAASEASPGAEAPAVSGEPAGSRRD